MLEYVAVPTPIVIIYSSLHELEQESYTPEIKKELANQKYNTKLLSREMFSPVNDTRRAFIPQTNSCRSKTGDIISDTQGDICSYEDIVPSYEEVNKAVEKPKNIKAAETNGISTELIKNTHNSDALKNAAGSFLMYLSESWVVKKTDEQRLAVFKRKVPRRIYGPKEENCK
ncbi:hypothetical protein CWI38_1341p0010 [Hamiltosporidium tvaerminnensis]|uniref:Uncharacterized protein n=1 Tax=Hamiltosporidium tvaerminnensis TaxID=1176355 RepID=A0A4Q9LU92_9MICR|nr:hypothetical protein CWI38_1341p0010 [Hamiltosporidium tvaerminnensis]